MSRIKFAIIVQPQSIWHLPRLVADIIHICVYTGRAENVDVIGSVIWPLSKYYIATLT